MYKRVLVPVDDSATSRRGLEEAMALAADQKAELRLLHVIDLHAVMYASADGTVLTESTMKAVRDAGRALLDTAQAKAATAGVPVTSALVETAGGTVGETIVGQASDFKADLIVMGTHGRRGVRRLLLGSDAASVASLAKVPVLLVRASES